MFVEKALGHSEKKLIKKEFKEIKNREDYLKKFLQQGCLGTLGVGMILYLLIPDYLYPILGTSVIICIITIGVYYEEINKLQQRRSNLNFLEKKNHVLSLRIKSERFYQLCEEEDEGGEYLFELNNNKLLFFGGQEYYPNNKFPNSDFEIVIGKGQSGETVIFKIFTFGNKIKPLRKVKSDDKSRLYHLANIVPDNFSEINGNLQTIESELNASQHDV